MKPKVKGQLLKYYMVHPDEVPMPKITPWKIRRAFEHKGTVKRRTIVAEEAEKRAGQVVEIVKKKYDALISKEAAEILTPTGRQIIEAAHNDDSPAVAVIAMGELMCRIAAANKLIDDMIKKELAKPTPNEKILQWAAKFNLESAEKLDIVRKYNEGLHEMRHGKKVLNVNARVKTPIDEFKTVDAEVVSDNPEQDTAKKGVFDTDSK